jgi:hypothetical protein
LEVFLPLSAGSAGRIKIKSVPTENTDKISQGFLRINFFLEVFLHLSPGSAGELK